MKRLQLVAQVFANALARKRADEALRESEERLALAADSAEAGLWILDYGTGCFWATDRARAIFGFSPDEVITMERLKASVHPDDWDLVRGAIERLRASGRSPSAWSTGSCRARALQRAGCRPVAGPSSTSTGEPERLMGSLRRHHRAQARRAGAIARARLAWTAGAELAGLAFYEVDFGAGVVYVDDRFRDLCGLPPDREEGLQALEFWMEHLHPDDRPRVLERAERLHDGKLERLSLEYRFLHPEPGEKWIQHIGRVARATPPDARSGRTASSGTSPNASAPRMSCTI